MKKIKYKIKNPEGIHARPVVLLVNQFRQFKCNVAIEKNGKAVNAKEIFSLMSLGIKQNDIINITFNGEDEEEASKTAENFFKKSI